MILFVTYSLILYRLTVTGSLQLCKLIERIILIGLYRLFLRIEKKSEQMPGLRCVASLW